MKLHLIGMPHTRVHADFCGCAYTGKALKFSKMMAARGWEIILYAPEGSDDDHCELVPVISDDERVGIFGPDDPARLPDWPTDAQCALFNARTTAALLERLEPHDLVLLTMGWSQRAIAQALPPHVLACEPGVGYEGVLDGFRAFESYAWMHHVYAKKGEADGRWYDAVIPNYFDPDELPLGEGGDYLVFLGRLISRKGPHVAAQIAEAAGMRLVVAGAGATSWSDGLIVAPEATLQGDVEYIGPVGVKARAGLLAGARALLVPTTYIEPFGGVAVEAMMCGTPAIATDWGAFTESVSEGVSGYRFRTLLEGVRAVERAGELDRRRVREYALGKYSLEAIAPRFEEWFGRLQSLWGEGWYASDSEHDLRSVRQAACA